MKRKLGRVLGLILSGAMTLSILCTMPVVFAKLNATINLATSDTTINIGDTATFNFTITPDHDGCALQASISVSGGLKIESVTLNGSSDGYNNGTLLYDKNDVDVHTGVITVSATAGGDQTVSLTNVKLSYVQNPTDNFTNGTASKTIHVRTADEKASSEAASESASIAESSSIAEQESIEASSRAVQESIEASSRAVQESIEASSRAAQEKINQSIAAEEASRQQSKAQEEAKKNSSIAESAAKEQSEQESRAKASSIEESIKEASSIEESIADLTRATEMNGSYFVPYVLDADELDERFFFLVSEALLEAPTNYIKTGLYINNQAVWAYQTAEMDTRVFLVYGTFGEEEEPKFYYYVSTDNTFFAYDYLFSGESHTVEAPSETTTVSASSLVAGEGESVVTYSNLALLILLSLLLGASVTSFILLLKMNGREQKELHAKRVEKHKHHVEKEDDVVSEHSYHETPVSLLKVDEPKTAQEKAESKKDPIEESEIEDIILGDEEEEDIGDILSKFD